MTPLSISLPTADALPSMSLDETVDALQTQVSQAEWEAMLQETKIPEEKRDAFIRQVQETATRIRDELNQMKCSISSPFLLERYAREGMEELKGMAHAYSDSCAFYTQAKEKTAALLARLNQPEILAASGIGAAAGGARGYLQEKVQRLGRWEKEQAIVVTADKALDKQEVRFAHAIKRLTVEKLRQTIQHPEDPLARLKVTAALEKARLNSAVAEGRLIIARDALVRAVARTKIATMAAVRIPIKDALGAIAKGAISGAFKAGIVATALLSPSEAH